MSSLVLFCQPVRQQLLTSRRNLRCFIHISSSNTLLPIRCISSCRLIKAQNRKPSNNAELNPIRRRDEDDEDEEDEEESSTSKAAFQGWLANQGRHYKHPSYTGSKWLGGSVPFPLNPTFKPPPPLSRKVKDAIYRAYILNPITNDARSLSLRFGISIPRIEAVLKLKALEAVWANSENGTLSLQTGFQEGMERLLGVNDIGINLAEELNSPVRDAVKDADEAAAVTSAAVQEHVGQKYLSRTYFEPVDEGQSPIVPNLITEARAQVKLRHDTSSPATSTLEYPSHVVQPNPNRPAWRFVDVGLKWFDSADAARRQKESERRRKVKARRGTSKQRNERRAMRELKKRMKRPKVRNLG